MRQWRLLLTTYIAALALFAQAPKEPAERPRPIPPAEIVSRSQELALPLANITKGLVPPEALADMQRRLMDQSGRLQAAAKESRATIAAGPTSLDLREHERQWRQLGRSESELSNQLTGWTNAAIASIRTLDADEATWKATLDSISTDLNSESLRQVVNRTIREIQKVRTQVENQLNRIVTLQERAAGQLILISQVQDEITQAEATFQSRLLEQNAEPIWRSSSGSGNSASTLVSQSIAENTRILSEFVRVRGVTVFIGVVSFLLVLVFIYRARGRLSPQYQTSEPPKASVVIERPLAVAFILQLPFGLVLLNDAPVALIALLVLASVVPILRILLHRAPRAARSAYLLSGVYVTGVILDVIPVDSPLRRAAFAGLLAAGVGALAWMAKTRAFRVPRVFGGSTRFLKFGVGIILVTLLAALGASLLGYLALAQFLRQSILLSSYLALLLLAWARVSTILVVAAIHSRFVSSSTLRNPEAELWVRYLFGGTAFILWFIAVSRLLLLRGPLERIGRKILSLSLPGRLSGVTLGDLLACAAVLVVGFLLARALRFLLREDVLSRFKLERGVPELISNLAYYLLLLFVFLASLQAVGVELSKLTLLTGAFGVGLGFGMQNVVNNFVSGLILQFERPIHTGDIIEVAGQIGEVRRIGIRSTAIRTPQGAELIVPNASLVSTNVVNWTLTTQGRQISLPVLASAGADPEMVIPLLVQAAEENPAVLHDPRPTAYLKNSGPNGVVFQLSFSIERSASADRVRESVASAAARALSHAKATTHPAAH